jgi:hypothetical protein
MAKKTVETKVEKVDRRGRKFCPGCHESSGARLGECKKCGYIFRPKSESAEKMIMNPYHLQAVMQFVAAIGGFSAARQALRDAEGFLKTVAAFNEKGLT